MREKAGAVIVTRSFYPIRQVQARAQDIGSTWDLTRTAVLASLRAMSCLTGKMRQQSPRKFGVIFPHGATGLRPRAAQPSHGAARGLGWVIGVASLMLLISRGFCADVTPAASSQAGDVLETEHIFVCSIFAPDARGTNTTISSLKRIGARKRGATWSYTSTRQKKAFEIHLVVNSSDMAEALYTEKAHIIIRGHSNFGLGGVYATSREFAAQTITSIRYMDDDRLVNYSSPWVAVNVPRLLAHQSFPNWWPVFQDGTSAIMPYDFNDPRGDPPYNYYLTYQVPGDPTWHRIETVDNSALERFPGCDKPAWHAADGSGPDPGNPDHAQYYLTNTNGAFETIGRWLGSSTGRGYLGTSYLYAPAGTGLNQVGWFFSIPTPGTYTVSALWPASARNVASAQYSVTHALGMTTASVNQKINGGNWNKLGDFVFDAGEYAVVLTDKPGSGTGTVIADAVRIMGVTNGGTFDQIIDNSACPKAHYGKKTIVFRKQLAIDPEKLRYTRMYYDGCYSGQYFLGTFHRGLTFYTVNDSEMRGFETYLKFYFGGASDEQIWAAMQRVQPVYDYYDFTKAPAGQTTAQAQSRLVPAVPSANQEAQIRPLAEIPAVRALATLERRRIHSRCGIVARSGAASLRPPESGRDCAGAKGYGLAGAAERGGAGAKPG